VPGIIGVGDHVDHAEDQHAHGLLEVDVRGELGMVDDDVGVPDVGQDRGEARADRAERLAVGHGDLVDVDIADSGVEVHG